MKLPRNHGTKQGLTTVGALALLLAAGCRTSGNSDVKDIHANGQSNSGKSAIALEFYPVKRGGSTVIQMERCVTQFSNGRRDCATYCTDESSLRRELTAQGVSNPSGVVAAIMSPGDRNFGGDFKALQSTFLDMKEKGRATACADQRQFNPPQVQPKGITKQTSADRRRSGMEIADSYTLMPSGDFFRDVNGIKCQITAKVDDFKVSQHPKDAALVYFIKGGDLWVVKPSPEPAFGNCPQTAAKVIMSSVARSGSNYDYWVTSDIHTTVVNSARDVSGMFRAWDNEYPVYSSGSRVVDVDMNQCFGVDGKSFNTYVAFLLTRSNTVIKVKGDPSDRDFSNEDFGAYSSLNQFRSKNAVCK